MLVAIIAACFAANLELPLLSFHLELQEPLSISQLNSVANLEDLQSPEHFPEYQPPSFHLESESTAFHQSASVEAHVLGQRPRLESAIRELAFNEETTRQLQEQIESEEFSAQEVSLVSNDLLVSAMGHKQANFVVSCLIKIFPKVMISKLFYNTRRTSWDLRFLIAFLLTKNLEVEDSILTRVSQSGVLQKILLSFMYNNKNVGVSILQFVNSPQWADEIALFMLQNLKKPKLEVCALSAILACSHQHHPNLIRADTWIAQNFSDEYIARRKMRSLNKSTPSRRKEKASRK